MKVIPDDLSFYRVFILTNETATNDSDSAYTEDFDTID